MFLLHINLINQLDPVVNVSNIVLRWYDMTLTDRLGYTTRIAHIYLNEKSTEDYKSISTVPSFYIYALV